MPSSVTDLSATARHFQALSDTTRLQIIGMLGDGEHCVCDLMAELDAAQSRLSFHLKVLKDAGLVDDRRDGRWVYYSLRRDALEQLAEILTMPAYQWKRAARCC